jgi:predicted deacylase
MFRISFFSWSMRSMELRSKTIVGQAAGPHLVIVGGVHGDEWEPMAACRRLIKELDSAQLRGRVTLVPCVNEAAFARGTRMADDLLDLARVCPGKEDGSVTEQTAAALAKLIRTADYFIDMHTAGTVFNLQRLAGYGIHFDAQVNEKQRLMARAFNLPIVWGTDGRFKGTSLSVAREANVPAIYVENGGGGICDAARVQENVDGCLNVARALGMLDGTLTASKVAFFIEDDRPMSGYLQGKCQAQVAGYFQPEVALGDKVRQGDRVGAIVDPLGEELAVIPAYTSGIVHLVRTFPSVKSGDPLIVILPVDGPGEYVFANNS